jgi:uncharacterized protein YneF (UPF0154 family)
MDKEKKRSRGSEFWQIIFPAFIGLILIGLLCALVVVGVNPVEITRFAEISTVLLVIPVVIISLLSFVILGLFIYLVQRLIIGIPPISTQILDFLDQIRTTVQKISDKIIQQVINPAAIITAIRNLFIKKGTRYRVE